jgi:hypothetical protein
LLGGHVFHAALEIPAALAILAALALSPKD